nr:MAG TPA: hypothetical protein [Caudoviricetes sp.]
MLKNQHLAQRGVLFFVQNIKNHFGYFCNRPID